MLNFLKTNDSTNFNAWHELNCNIPILFKNQHLQNLFVTEFNLVNMDFSGSIIEDCYFKKVNFFASNFTNVQFKNCYFVSCHFGTPELINAKSYLMNFAFKSPIFFNTYFFKTKFLNTNFREKDLENTYFEECILEQCNFKNANLSGIKDNHSNSLNNLV